MNKDEDWTTMVIDRRGLYIEAQRVFGPWLQVRAVKALKS